MSDTLQRRNRRQTPPAPSALPSPEPAQQTPPVALTGAAAAADTSNHRYRWIILIGLILAAAMEVLDTTIINVALPQMAGNLSTTTQEDRLGFHRLHSVQRRRASHDRLL